MAWQTLRYKLTSSAPLLMHNGQTADPLNKWAKAIKKISSKRAKTESDYEEMARLEFLSGLYMSPDGPVIPTYVIDSMMVNAAKKFKEGQTAKSAVFCLANASLEYDGPRQADELVKDERFRFVANVRVGQARVSRTRPVFEKWSCIVEVQIENTLVNPSRVDEWMFVAGTQIGLGDWRPQHGRFIVERLTQESEPAEKRDIGQEILDGVREIKAHKASISNNLVEKVVVSPSSG